MPVCAFKSFANPPSVGRYDYAALECDSPSSERDSPSLGRHDSLSAERPDPARIESANVAVRSDRGVTQAVLGTLREVLAFEGLYESRSETQDGFYFAIEDDEVCLTYAEEEHRTDRRNDGPRSTPSRNERAFLKCCDALARKGIAFTLFMSPRTAALRVRAD